MWGQRRGRGPVPLYPEATSRVEREHPDRPAEGASGMAMARASVRGGAQDRALVWALLESLCGPRQSPSLLWSPQQTPKLSPQPLLC